MSDTPAGSGAGALVGGATADGPHLRLGTRGSPLALAQSGTIADALRALGATVEIITIRTAGDGRAPNEVWGEGAFVTALELALLEGRIDVAVHSAKDVPTAQDRGLRIAAFPTREDPRDALVTIDPGVTLDTLPRGARIGTDSPRRVAFLLAHRPDLRPHPLHGNVDTRLRRLADRESDALVLAVAGLNRLGLGARITQALPADVLPPAPGQGALAVQCRADDLVAGLLVEQLDDPATRVAVEAERAFLAASGGGCRAPLGALGTVRDGILELTVAAADPADVPTGDAPPSSAGSSPGTTFTAPGPAGRGVAVAWLNRTAPATEGQALAEAMAQEVKATIAGRSVGRRGRILVTREAERAGALLHALRASGLDPVNVPTIAVEPNAPGGSLDDAISALSTYDWVVVTSASGADALGGAAARGGTELRATRIAAVGAATATAVERAGGHTTFVPGAATAWALAEQLPVRAGDRVLLVRGNLADERLALRLRARGAVVDDVIAYRTIEAPAPSRAALRATIRDGLRGIVFTSGSTVRGLIALLGVDERGGVLDLPAFCIGPSTASAARAAGFSTVHEAAGPGPEALADLVRAWLAQTAWAHPLATTGKETS